MFKKEISIELTLTSDLKIEWSQNQILALVAVRKGMDYLFSQHDLSFLDDVIPEKDKKKKEDDKKKKKKRGSIDSDADDVSLGYVHLLHL